jgi:signal transduction histidine kinase
VSSQQQALKLLTEFTKDLGTLNKLSALAERTAVGIAQCLGTAQSSLFLLDREKDVYVRFDPIQEGSQTGSRQSFQTNHPLVKRLRMDHEPLRRTTIETPSTSPGLDEADLLETLRFLNASICIPLATRTRLVGFCVLGPPRRLEQDYAQASALASAMAQIAANALDNAMLTEDLHRSQALVRRTDRLRSLEIIAGGFAHEIRNPLTSIKTFIQLAPERKDDAEFIGEFSKVVIDDVYRIERLIQEILDYARYMEPKLTEEDLNDIVSSCLYFIEVKASSLGIKIEKDLADDLPRVMLDRQQIKQVLLNLFLNAMDAMAETKGGSLRVRTRTLPKSSGTPWIQIQVEDTGRGISAGNLEHVFDPFFTTKHKSGEHEGTGLGLTIVHQIVQEHQGSIEVQSTEGVGTTFLINLPECPRAREVNY